ncbi:glycine zipper 2TM domain-containing protein [Aurantiacibacter rhizosphaerae]|uniref:17 kDa surface antigen n=1 Tax=Aurantiacibacter rhizosphaerae TaxID=2691582 RepID=A0A844X961_9SPHN|nr:glycine zipper 2TM domain-containing protein [Aurantiacibacter rhizosphaerae]MWV26329.1 glycine zipper 2TM domain-containing protein [Aurantiacibacter rhizosphaerae]
MSTRFTLLLSSAALMAVATPAAAQDEPVIQADYVENNGISGAYDGEWQGDWSADDSWRGTWTGRYTTPSGEVLEGEYVGRFVGEGRFITDDGRTFTFGDSGWRGDDGGYEIQGAASQLGLAASPDGRLAYTLAEREAWLSDCRLLMADQGGYARYHDRDDDIGGGLIGGLLGAVVGGFAGNRIDDDGSRLAGTLIGAGLGGVAGAVIGSAIDSADEDDGYAYREMDANELWAARYCDAYLRRYEMSSAVGPSHGHHHNRHGPECTTTVREEWVEVEQPAPAPRPASRIIPRPQPSGKTARVK